MRKSDKIIYASRPIMVVTDRQTDQPKSYSLEENLTESVVNGPRLRSSGKKRKPPKMEAASFFEALLTLY